MLLFQTSVTYFLVVFSRILYQEYFSFTMFKLQFIDPNLTQTRQNIPPKTNFRRLDCLNTPSQNDTILYPLIQDTHILTLETAIIPHIYRNIYTSHHLREAARHCRVKKKEYLKCLEERVQILEGQNKKLIDELKALKEFYTQHKKDYPEHNI